MKIIGRTDHGFILQATEEEAGAITGLEFPAYRNRFGVGDEIKVAAIFEHLLSIRKNKNALAQHAREIRALADLLDAKDPILVAEGEAVIEATQKQSA